MGHKVHPKSLRLGYIQGWDSMWYSDKNFAAYVLEDYKIREHIFEKYKYSGVSRIYIERHPENVKVDIHTARPALIIGRRGTDKESLKADLQKIAQKNVVVNIIEVFKPEMDARVVCENIVLQLEKKINHRKASKRAMERAMEAGAKGIKIMVGGRIGGAEIARNEWFKQGRVPLSTFRSDIEFASLFSLTKYGKIGVKVWIFKNDILKERKSINPAARPKPAEDAASSAPGTAPVPGDIQPGEKT